MSYSLADFKEILDGLGFHLGPDGLNGNNSSTLDSYTQAAMREFQHQYNLPLTGQLDAATEEQAQKAIRHLQYSLNLAIDAQLPVSGFYTPQTLQAVKTFQRRYRLPVTGVATLTVRLKINQVARQHVVISA